MTKDKGSTEKRTSRKGKWIKMAILSLGYMGAGTSYTVPGTSLLDLEIRTTSSTKTIAFIFFLRAAGGLIGSLFGGFLFDLYNTDIILSIMEVIAACAIIVAPWWTNVIGLSTSIGISGLSCSMVNVGCNFYCVSLWGKDHAPYLHLLQFINSLACVAILPLVRALLLPKSETSLIAATLTNLTEHYRNESVLPIHAVLSRDGTNMSNLKPVTNKSSLDSIESLSMERNDSQISTVRYFYPNDVRVQYAFLMPGFLLALACIGHLVLVLLGGCKGKSIFTDKPSQDIVKEEYEKRPYDDIGSKFRLLLLLIGFGCLSANSGSLEENNSMFLFTFLVKQLKWTKAAATWPMFALNIAIFVAQFLCIGISKYVSSGVFSGGIHGVMLFGTVLMCFPIIRFVPTIWVYAILIGLTIGPLDATVMSWMSETFGPSGKITAFYFLLLYCARMIFSQLLGYLFDSVGPMWFVYLNVITVGVAFLGCVSLLLWTQLAGIKLPPERITNDGQDKQTELMSFKQTHFDCQEIKS